MSKISLQDKKDYLLAKYSKRDYKIEDLSPKFAVMFNPDIKSIKDWTLVSICDNKEQALYEILWRKKFVETNDGDLVVDNDDRFNTWRDETKNRNSQGLVYEPTQRDMNFDYNKNTPMLQIIASSPQNNEGFRGMAYYTNIELDYNGFYKIEEIYQI